MRFANALFEYFVQGVTTKEGILTIIDKNVNARSNYVKI